jgi:hypothetical protein
LFDVHTHAGLEKIERVPPYAFVLMLKLHSREWNQYRLRSNVGGVASDPVPGGQACVIKFLSNSRGVEGKRIMRRTANNGQKRKKSILCINNCLEGYAVKSLPTIVVSWDKIVTRLSDLDSDTVNSSNTAYKRIKMCSRLCKVSRHCVELADIVKW